MVGKDTLSLDLEVINHSLELPQGNGIHATAILNRRIETRLMKLTG
ncbi:MAG: hypothetical protein RLP02_08005 [Coleofasciculus sp. C2-GNP5-27]